MSRKTQHTLRSASSKGMCANDVASSKGLGTRLLAIRARAAAWEDTAVERSMTPVTTVTSVTKDAGGFFHRNR